MSEESPEDIVKRCQIMIRRVSDTLDADIIAYAGPIDTPHDARFIDQVRRRKKRKNVLLSMGTSGGSADSAYRMMRYLHHQYAGGKVTFLIVDRCKSAGTLMAMGADEIVMVDDSELGPLDVQVLKPDELGEYTSGLTAYQALTALRNETFQSFESYFLRLRRYSGFQITTRTAASIAAKLSVGGVQKLYDQLDPMRIAEHQRAMTIAQEYGTRLDRGNLKPEAIERLIADYPSHGFLIDFTEALTLFENVRLPTAEEFELCLFLMHSNLCQEPPHGAESVISYVTQEFLAQKDDKPIAPTGVKNEEPNGKSRKASEAASNGSIPADRARNPRSHRKGRGAKRGKKGARRGSRSNDGNGAKLPGQTALDPDQRDQLA